MRRSGCPIRGLAACLMTCCLSTALAAAGSTAAAPNLVTNPSFEQFGRLAMPEGWHGDRRVYAIDTEVHRSGKSSLRLTNTDPGRYRLCSQKVPLRPAGNADSACGSRPRTFRVQSPGQRSAWSGTMPAASGWAGVIPRESREPTTGSKSKNRAGAGEGRLGDAFLLRPPWHDG